MGHLSVYHCLTGEKPRQRHTHKKNERSEEYKWKRDSVYWKNKDTGGVSCGRVRRVFIYAIGFMASCVCWMAWEPSPPGQRKQHHFKLECPLRRQVSCQEVHGSRIPTKSTDLFPNNCCVHLSHSAERPPSRYTGAPVSPPTFTRADAALRSNRSMFLSKRGVSVICHRSLRKDFKFLEYFLWSETHKSHIVGEYHHELRWATSLPPKERFTQIWKFNHPLTVCFHVHEKEQLSISVCQPGNHTNRPAPTPGLMSQQNQMECSLHYCYLLNRAVRKTKRPSSERSSTWWG